MNWQESDGTEGGDDDGNGYVDDIYGWNFVFENNNAKDDHGHDTHLVDYANYDTIVAVGGDYVLAAPGMSIYSTLPGEQYARWSGTSMAAR